MYSNTFATKLNPKDNFQLVFTLICYVGGSRFIYAMLVG